MDQKYLARFAGKNLLSHKLRTFLTIIGMVIGISAITFLIAFAFGVEKIVTKEITGGNAFELLDIGTGNSQIIKLNDETLGKIRDITGISSVHTTSNMAAIATNSDGSTVDSSFLATDAVYMNWSSIEPNWGESLPDKPSDPDNKPIIVSTGLLKVLAIEDPVKALGQKVNFDLVAPKELTGSDKKTFENQIFTIIGVVKYEANIAYAKIADIKPLELPNYSQAKVEIKNPQDVEKVTIQIENLGFKTQYVGETVEQVEQVFAFFKIILGSFGLIAMIVASLAMFNTLTISLLERTKEVALLKILGMRKKDISRLFLTEAMAMGLVGGILGVITGIVFSSVANMIFNHFAIQEGGDPIRVFVFPLWFILCVFLFSLLVGFLTGLYPARRAMRVNALDVMRYE